MAENKHGWLYWGTLLLFAIAGSAAVTWVAPRPQIEIPELVFKVGTAQCLPNGGLQKVLILGEKRYTFVCENAANFLNQGVVPKEKEVGKVTAEAVLK